MTASRRSCRVVAAQPAKGSAGQQEAAGAIFTAGKRIYKRIKGRSTAPPMQALSSRQAQRPDCKRPEAMPFALSALALPAAKTVQRLYEAGMIASDNQAQETGRQSGHKRAGGGLKIAL